MDNEPHKRPRPVDLIKIGVASGYASRLSRGLALPSMKLAKRIETELGYPVAAWTEREGAA